VNTKKISVLFETSPTQWGLRGDPFLWEEISRTIGELPLPNTESQFTSLLELTFEHLVGYPLVHQAKVYIKRYAKGGMSSGYICPKFWRKEVVPLLRVRYLASR
jgi:hypothetical protein